MLQKVLCRDNTEAISSFMGDVVGPKVDYTIVKKLLYTESIINLVVI